MVDAYRNLIGAPDTNWGQTTGIPTGEFDTHNGALDINIGAKGTPIGGDEIHKDCANVTYVQFI